MFERKKHTFQVELVLPFFSFLQVLPVLKTIF